MLTALGMNLLVPSGNFPGSRSFALYYQSLRNAGSLVAAVLRHKIVPQRLRCPPLTAPAPEAPVGLGSYSS